MVDQFPGHCGVALVIALPQRHAQRGHHQVDDLGCRGVPGHDPLSGDVDDEGHVDETGPAAHIGEVGDPDQIGRRGGEVPVKQISGPAAADSRHGGADFLDPAHALQPQYAHGPVHRPGRSLRQPATDQRGHLVPPVEPLGGQYSLTGGIDGPRGLPHRVDDLRVGDGACRHRPAWLLPGPVGARGDLAALLTQNPADRLDRVPGGALIVDEREDQRLRGSSSPAKKVVAAFRIETSSRSLRFSARSRLISSFSALVAPGLWPASIWD